jgi:hypothetical protein
VASDYEPKPWADDVPLAGPRRPKNDDSIEYLIGYLLTVRKRFGNTCVTCDLQWGASALHKLSDLAAQAKGVTG